MTKPRAHFLYGAAALDTPMLDPMSDLDVGDPSHGMQASRVAEARNHLYLLFTAMGIPRVV